MWLKYLAVVARKKIAFDQCIQGRGYHPVFGSDLHMHTKSKLGPASVLLKLAHFEGERLTESLKTTGQGYIDKSSYLTCVIYDLEKPLQIDWDSTWSKEMSLR